MPDDDVVISVDNLSKRYLVGHETARRGYKTYNSLREMVMRQAKNICRKALDMVRGRQIVQGDEVEEFWALKDVSFEVKRGEVVGIIGRNGAGKSTLLKVLSRITEPTEGRIRITGRVASLLEVGTGFHPELTGRENIFLNGAILGMTRREINAKFDEIVAFADVERFLDTPVKRYSSGMYVRLAFAVAAHLEPEILIIDEVLAVGDAAFQKKCLGKMREVSENGRTILFVSHNMQAVQTLCSRCICLAGGVLISDGSVQPVVETYLSRIAPLTSIWIRPQSDTPAPVFFQRIEASLRGKQPRMQLILDTKIVCARNSADLLIAIDLSDGLGGPLFQALAAPEPLMMGTKGEYTLCIEIDLPPLVPGRYIAHFWLGPHFTETFDYVKDAVEIVIPESPTANRTFPHSADHGYIVPTSRCYIKQTASV